jgi:hypothetical protein
MSNEPKEGIEMPEITLGMLKVEDAEELRRVAERDSREAPTGMVLGARVDGRLVAARSVSNGYAVADPFVHTAELQELLAERATQLRGGDSGRRGGLFRGYSSSSARPAA